MIKVYFENNFLLVNYKYCFIELYVYVLLVSNSILYFIYVQVLYREIFFIVRFFCGKIYFEESQYMYYIYNIVMNMSIVFDFIFIL